MDMSIKDIINVIGLWVCFVGGVGIGIFTRFINFYWKRNGKFFFRGALLNITLIIILVIIVTMAEYRLYEIFGVKL